MICDAYSMNLTPENDLWIYFYTKFPIVLVRGDRYDTWSCGLAGARALVIRDRRVLLFGGYEERAMARIVALDGRSRAELVATGSVVDSAGKLFDSARAFGVGDRLFLERDRQVFVVDEW